MVDLVNVVKQLEKEQGKVLQIKIQSIEGEEEIYGSFETRPLTVSLLNLSDLSPEFLRRFNLKIENIRHDVNLLVGGYNSMKQLEGKTERLHSNLYDCYTLVKIIKTFKKLKSNYEKSETRKKIEKFLIEKYGTEEKEIKVVIPQEHRVASEKFIKIKGWDFLCSTEELAEKNPKMYNSIINFLNAENIPFLYNNLKSGNNGVFIINKEFDLMDFSHIYDRYSSNNLGIKIADIKFNFL